MPPKKTAAGSSPKTNHSVALTKKSAKPAARGKLGLTSGYVLLVLSSLLTSSALYTLVSPYISNELAAVSRRLDNNYEVVALVAWRMIELAVGWWGRFDGIDFAALMLVNHLPTAILLSTFHSIPLPTIAATLLIDLLSIAAPVILLRPNSALHTPNLPSRLPNRSILSSPQILIYTTSLATVLLTLPFYTLLRTLLPPLLVRNFDNITTLAPAYDSNLPLLILELLPLGFFMHTFVFEPAIALSHASAPKPFEPESATFAETVEHNVWGALPKRTRCVIERTVVLALAGIVGTTVRVAATVGGSTVVGAAGWALSFSTGIFMAGLGLWWVGRAQNV